MGERNDPTKLPVHRWTQERLSAYVDNDLTPAERDRVRAHVAECDRCAQDLDDLRQTVAWLRQMPTHPAPRSFAVSAQHAATRSRVAWLAPYFRAAGALAAILLIVVVAADFLQTSGGIRMAAAPAPHLNGLSAAPPPPPTQNEAGAPAASSAAKPPPRTPAGSAHRTLGAGVPAPAATASPAAPARDMARQEALATESTEEKAGEASSLAAAPPAPPATGSPAAPLLRKAAPAATPSLKDEGGAAEPPSGALLPQSAAPTRPPVPQPEYAAPGSITGTLAVPAAPQVASPSPAPTPAVTILAAPRPALWWVLRVLEAGLLLGAVGFFAGAWWLARRR